MIVFLSRLLARLPLRWVQALGAVLGRLVYWTSASYRGRLRTNMRLAGLDPERDAGAAAAEAGRQALEMPWVWLRPRGDLAGRVAWADAEVMAEAMADGRAVIVLTPHLGCFEAIAQAYALSPAARSRPMTALYRVPRKTALRPLAERARAQDGLLLAPADLRGVRMLMRAVRERQVLGILPDQVPAQGEGAWAPFFGQPAYTMTLPGRLAERGRAVVLMLGAERLPRGRGFRIHAERLPEALCGDPRQDAAIINRAVERMVLRFPLQYLWGYNRYKRPAGVPSADASCAPPC
jgi:KDO2-lipid IV(A) lauroyltransferase